MAPAMRPAMVPTVRANRVKFRLQSHPRDSLFRFIDDGIRTRLPPFQRQCQLEFSADFPLAIVAVRIAARKNKEHEVDDPVACNRSASVKQHQFPTVP